MAESPPKFVRFSLPIMPPSVRDYRSVLWQEYFDYFSNAQLTNIVGDPMVPYMRQGVAWTGYVISAQEREVLIRMNPTDNSEYDVKLTCGLFDRFDLGYFRPNRRVFFTGIINKVNFNKTLTEWSYELSYFPLREKYLERFPLLTASAAGDKRARKKAEGLTREIDQLQKMVTGPVWLELMQHAGKEARLLADVAFLRYFKDVEVKWTGRLFNNLRSKNRAEVTMIAGSQTPQIVCQYPRTHSIHKSVTKGSWMTVVGRLRTRGSFQPNEKRVCTELEGTINPTCEAASEVSKAFLSQPCRPRTDHMNTYTQQTHSLQTAIERSKGEVLEAYSRLSRGEEPSLPTVSPLPSPRQVTTQAPAPTQAVQTPTKPQSFHAPSVPVGRDPSSLTSVFFGGAKATPTPPRNPGAGQVTDLFFGPSPAVPPAPGPQRPTQSLLFGPSSEETSAPAPQQPQIVFHSVAGQSQKPASTTQSHPDEPIDATAVRSPNPLAEPEAQVAESQMPKPPQPPQAPQLARPPPPPQSPLRQATTDLQPQSAASPQVPPVPLQPQTPDQRMTPQQHVQQRPSNPSSIRDSPRITQDQPQSLGALIDELMENAPAFEVFQTADEFEIRQREEVEAERRRIEREMQEKIAADEQFLQRAEEVAQRPPQELRPDWEEAQHEEEYDPLKAFQGAPEPEVQYQPPEQQFVAGTDTYGEFQHEEPQQRFADLDAYADYAPNDNYDTGYDYGTGFGADYVYDAGYGDYDDGGYGY